MKPKTISTILTLALTIGLCQTAAPTQAATQKLSTKKLTINVGKSATLKVKKSSKKAVWSIASGKKYIRLMAKKKASVKIKAKKAGKAKVSCKIGKKKLYCKVIVKDTVKVVESKPSEMPAVTASAKPIQSATATPDVTPTPTVTPTQTPEATKVPVRTHEPTEDRIMAEPAKYTELPTVDEEGIPFGYISSNRIYYFLGTPILRKEIEKLSLTFHANVPKDVLGSFDLSEKQNGSVMAWYTDEDQDGLYEMTIGQLGGVVANPNSSFLFADMSYVTGLEELYTTGVTDMSYMFYRYRFGKAFTMKNVKSAVLMFRWMYEPGVQYAYVTNQETKDYLKKQLPESMIIVEN